MPEHIHDHLTLKGRVRLAVWNPDGSLASEQIVDNLVVTAGRALLAQAFANPSIDVRVSHVELGTGTTAPANGDTVLETPSYRNAIASALNVSNVATLTGFFSATECNGTYREAGLFINGTGSLGTGTLLSRVAINITKSAIQTLTIEWAITLS
ncbi:MAG: hypothetical protein WCV84_04710 [Patescibacteria group bacterium]